MNVINYGNTKSGYHRFKCKNCNCTYTYRNHINKVKRERTWFELWIIEGYSIRQLIKISKHGRWKLKQIKKYWLDRKPDEINFNFSSVKYLIFDGTYFNHENCLMILIDNITGHVITSKYAVRENYYSAIEIFNNIKGKGVNPIAITVDGNTSVIRAIKEVWPEIIIQRCKTHIQMQGLAWLRRPPKLKVSKELQKVFLVLSNVNNKQDMNLFITKFSRWEKRYGKYTKSLPKDHKVYSDIQRAYSLIVHALPNMFHYLKDDNIAATTNKLEGYFSQLKGRYRQHKGMSKTNRQNYLKWYIYLRNKQ